jgi:O-antigen/teichoic acid export membrane protein
MSRVQRPLTLVLLPFILLAMVLAIIGAWLLGAVVTAGVLVGFFVIDTHYRKREASS